MRERVRVIGAFVILICMIVPSIGMAGSIDEHTAGISDPDIVNIPDPDIPGSLSGIKICIDPGHGGSANGTTGIDGPGYPDEKDHNLDIGLRLQTLLEAVGATVIMTRTTDVDVSLQERCDIANGNSTDIFISIHCNSIGLANVMGIETFYWGVDAMTYSANGKRLAEDVQAKEVAILGSNDRGAKGDFEYLGYHLYVLDNTAMPAILTEVGFMSNQTEFDLLNTPEYRQDAAQGILNGVMAYYGLSISIFDIDMWQTSDTGQFSMLNSQVDTSDTYTFFTEVNYTTGGVDELFDGTDNGRVELKAWLDEGVIGAGSSYDLAEPNDKRTKQFRMEWQEGVGGPGSGTANMLYPIGSPGINEFMLDSWWIDPIGYGIDGNTHRIFFNITFEKQTRAADGTGFGNGAAADINDKDQALNDPNSWDFNIRIYDAGFPTIENNSYEEFGVWDRQEINAVGNPSASAPPGSAQVVLAPNSQISLSSNQDYYLNVSITDLNRVDGGGMIMASNVQVASMSQLANDVNSQIATPGYFPGAGFDLGVWGNTSQVFADWVVPAPGNGTVAEGPWGSDFNAQGYTELAWWVDVPGATTEGMYFATITYTLGTYGGGVISDTSTELWLYTGFPHIFDIDMWEQSDPTETSVQNTMVPADNTYTFFMDVNYSIGGVNQLFDGVNNTIIELTAWYDDNGASEMSPPPSDIGHRTEKFEIRWFEGDGGAIPENAIMTYPGLPEFQLAGFNSQTGTFDHLELEFDIYFSDLAQLADGSGFFNGASADIYDLFQSFNDMNSWNFEFKIYDSSFPGAMNITYEEFGILNNDIVIPLEQGWNLISLPQIPSDVSMDSVLSSIAGKWDHILTYNASDPSDHWKTNATFKLNSLNDLSSIDHKIGFWINITQQNVNLTVSGIDPGSTSIPLYAGWNLVGYPTLNNTVKVSDALWGTGAIIVEICNTSMPYNIMEVDQNYIMQPGEGYWIYVPLYTVWTVDW